MSTLYVSATAVKHADEVMETHAGDAEGWCGFCLRHFRVRVRAGQCQPFQLAARVKSLFERQRLPRLSFTAGRVWP